MLDLPEKHEGVGRISIRVARYEGLGGTYGSCILLMLWYSGWLNEDDGNMLLFFGKSETVLLPVDGAKIVFNAIAVLFL